MSNTFEDKSRLVTLAYAVLGTIQLTVAELSDAEIFFELSTAFQRKAIQASAREDEQDRRRAKGRPPWPEPGELPDHLLVPNLEAAV